MSNYSRIEKAIDFYTREFKNQPSVKDAALHIGVSLPHFKRLFKQWAGVSPKKFLSVITTEYAKEQLEKSKSVLSTTHASGLSSQGRLYDHTVSLYGVTPGEVKKLGKGLRFSYGSAISPFGKVIIFFSDKGIAQMDFIINEEKEYTTLFKKRWPNSLLFKDQKLAKKIIDDIYNFKTPSIFNVHTIGTNFQLNVWKALIKLPPGAIVSYGQIAKYLKKPKAHRAVANAIGKNPIAFLIPCHRVIRESGLIGGYRWETPRKYAIQAIEALV